MIDAEMRDERVALVVLGDRINYDSCLFFGRRRNRMRTEWEG